MKLKQVLKEVRKIEIDTKRLVEGLLQGSYHSIFKGRGIEFSEVREYEVGDDIRIIDWNVTARLNKPYVKEYIEERDLNLYILFDISGSSEFGSTKTKKLAAIELSASLMFAAMKNNDNIGLAMFSEGVERFFKPRKGRKHVLRLIRELIYYSPKHKSTNIKQALKFMINILKRQSIIFIISDFLDDGFTKELKILNNKHDLILINIMDIRELEIPEIGFIELMDEETGETTIVNTSDREFQENYSRLIKNRIKKFHNTMRKLNIDVININAEESFAVPLRKFFYLRKRKLN